MLEDRDYMRAGPSHRRQSFSMSVWLAILIINVVVFFVQYGGGLDRRLAFLEYGALSLDGLKHGFFWQFLTFQFLHSGLPHLVLNLVVLYFFGRPMEFLLGKRVFLNLYLVSGFVGGIAQVLLGLCFERFAGPMVGASAGICGLIAAFALLNPQSTIYLFFILPIRAIYFLPLIVAVSAISLVAGGEDHVAHAAHLGGLLTGIAWVKFGWHQDFVRFPWDGWFARLRQKGTPSPGQPKRELVKAAAIRLPSWKKKPARGPMSEEPLSTEEFLSKEVDPILDKISAHGIQSLTERERKILEAARKKMGKR